MVSSGHDRAGDEIRSRRGGRRAASAQLRGAVLPPGQTGWLLARQFHHPVETLQRKLSNRHEETDKRQAHLSFQGFSGRWTLWYLRKQGAFGLKKGGNWLFPEAFPGR